MIPVAGPWITDKEIAYVTDAVSRAWYADANLYHARFEKSFTDYVGTRFAIALPSCTSAIHLALMAWNIGPEDEVIVPDVTWIASAAPVTYVGAKTLFADIDGTSWCMDPHAFESLITPRTKAVIPVDLYGHVCDMEAIRKIARKHGIHVLEDAAEAIGSSSGERRAGSLGEAGVFSFHGSKTLTTGEGGMLVTDDQKLYERVLFLRDHGRAPGDKHFRNLEVGYKYKMSSLQAALGLAQLERIEELIVKKRQIFEWYRARLGGIKGLRLNAEVPGTKNSYWMVSVILDPSFGLPKEELMKRLSARSVDSRPFFHPLSSLPAYTSFPDAAAARIRNRVSYAVSPYGVNLPSALGLQEQDVEEVCSVLRSILEGR